MILLGGAALEAILDLLDAADVTRGRFADEAASPAEFLHKVVGDVSELSREVLVDVEDVHVVIGHLSLVIGHLSGTNNRRPAVFDK